MISVKDLVKEGEEIKETFTNKQSGDSEYFTYSVNAEGLSKWITKSLRVIEKEEKQGIKSRIYKEFESKIGKASSLNLSEFNELLGILKGIDETKEDEGKDVFY